ncbi:MAG: hypothetical protein J0L82_13835 [Deltaproteobacteria bacterium]|jgi:hypothetical protein|nr:hypothetical protein [Deltaproteobacteria bacterium]
MAKIRELSGVLAAILTASLGLSLSACSGLKIKRSSDGSLEAPPPADSPAVVAEASDSSPDIQFPAVDVSQWSASDMAKTGVIFAWSLAGSKKLVGDSGCRLRMRQRETGDTVLIKIDTKNPVSIQALKPGTWDAKRLGCGVTRVWDLEGLMREGFVVKPGAMSVIGWFLFEFDDRRLVTVREGGRKENTAMVVQLRTVAGGWPSNASTLISGFSGKAIPVATKLEVRDEVVRVKALSLRDSDAKLLPLLNRFQGCASQGMKVDPLRAGTLKIEVSYKGGKYAGSKTSGADHALRDDLVQCILQAHENFVLDSGGDFTLETTY